MLPACCAPAAAAYAMSGGIANVVIAKATQAHKTARFRIIAVLSCVEAPLIYQRLPTPGRNRYRIAKLVADSVIVPSLAAFAGYAEAGFAGALFDHVCASICRVAAFEPGARFSRHAS